MSSRIDDKTYREPNRTFLFFPDGDSRVLYMSEGNNGEAGVWTEQCAADKADPPAGTACRPPPLPLPPRYPLRGILVYFALLALLSRNNIIMILEMIKIRTMTVVTLRRGYLKE